MKKISKILFVIAIVLIATATYKVSAKEITITSEEVWGTPSTLTNETVENVNMHFKTPYNNQIRPYGDKVPTAVWDWSKGDSTISGSTSHHELWSNYLYTGATTLNFGFTKAEQSFVMEIWEKDTGLFWADKKVATIEVKMITQQQEENGLTRIYYASGLNSSTKYFIKILPEATFKAYVRKV